MKTALVTGADGDLGGLIAQRLEVTHKVVRLTKENCDLRSRRDIEKVAERMDSSIDVLVNCAGLASINWLANIDEKEWDDVFDVNVKGPYLLVQNLLQFLYGGTVLNITSRAARVPMRCSAAYNSSKAALEMLTRQMGRELYQTHKIVVFGVAPNKLRHTAMSYWVDQRVCEVRGWTPEQAADYEKASRIVDGETPPHVVADFIAYLLSSRTNHLFLNGCILNYGD